jgi:iron-sulfur cluster repair protein YtfE (RIC family)
LKDEYLTPNAITVVHKYLRYELFGMCQVLASATPNQGEAVQSSLQSVVRLLYEHAEREDEHLGAMLETADIALAERMRWYHQRLDKHLEDILELAWQLNSVPADVRRRQLTQLHLDWNRFVSAYLAHMDDEERTLFPAIGDQLPPITAVAEGAAAQPDEERKHFLEKLEAAISPEEFGIIKSEIALRLDERGVFEDREVEQSSAKQLTT